MKYSDEIDGSVFLDVTKSDSLESLFEDIFNQLGIEYEEWDYFVGTQKIDIAKSLGENGVCEDCVIKPVPKASHEDSESDCDSEVVGEDFWKHWDLETDLMICKLQLQRMNDLEKTIKRDHFKFEHLLLQWGLREVRAIAAKVPPCQRCLPPRLTPNPSPRMSKIRLIPFGSSKLDQTTKHHFANGKSQ